MLITFKTKSYADIVMFGEVGIKMLEMMDYGVSVPGAIVAEDVPRSLINLKQGLESVIEIVQSADSTEDDQVKISLHLRAVPLIGLLQSAIDDENHVRWE